ncbi:MAG: hypothetical protein WDA10_11310 [Porticoccaceae bacterium]|jgi:hypothetical protein|nr:hypothetical protein [Porticoccaceae bacterium]MEA3299420.1 hypothetical protein [Pseudomonadota bacterium]HLS99393.1 hypothetical protein [Porticoccaceae bacterium]
MTYQCQDCSYQGTVFKGGRCPGCGSVNIRTLAPRQARPPLARKPYRLLLACALWLYLLVAIYRQLTG